MAICRIAAAAENKPKSPCLPPRLPSPCCAYSRRSDSACRSCSIANCTNLQASITEPPPILTITSALLLRTRSSRASASSRGVWALTPVLRPAMPGGNASRRPSSSAVAVARLFDATKNGRWYPYSCNSLGNATSAGSEKITLCSALYVNSMMPCLLMRRTASVCR